MLFVYIWRDSVTVSHFIIEWFIRTQVTLWSRSPMKNVIIWKFAFDTELFEVLMLLGQLAIWFILLDTRLDSLRKYTTVWPYQSFAQSG